MDGTASIFAAVSIAIQLADSVKKLSEFWKSVIEAPQDVQNIIIDLDLLTDALCEIALEAQQTDPDLTLATALRNCEVNTTVLIKTLNELQPGFASAKRTIRKWTAIKGILEWEKIKKFQATLDRLKSTLMLIRQNQISRSIRVQSQQQQRSFTSMERYISRLSTEGTSVATFGQSDQTWMRQKSSADYLPKISSGVMIAPNRTNHTGKSLVEVKCSAVPVNDLAGEVNMIKGTEEPLSASEQLMVSRVHQSAVKQKIWRKKRLYGDDVLRESFLGSVRVLSTARSLYFIDNDPAIKSIKGDQQRENDTFISIRPAPWLRKAGVMHGLCLRLLNSSIHGWKCTLSSFRLVPQDAPIFRYCSDGNLPAVRQLLLDGDASLKDVDSGGITPLHLAASAHHAELCKFLIMHGADKSALASSCRQSPLAWIFRNEKYPVNEIDVADTCSLFLDLVEFTNAEDDSWIALQSAIATSPTVTVILWLLRQVSHDVEDKFHASSYPNIFRLISYPMTTEILQFWLELGPERAIEGTNGLGPAALFETVAIANPRYSALLMCGVDPSCLCVNETSSQYESPTSIATYYSLAFARWRSHLHEAGIDINTLIQQELHQEPLAKFGWRAETLQKLFEWDFVATDNGTRWTCSDCEALHPLPNVQPFWLCCLEEIKCGKDPEGTAWHKDSLLDQQNDSRLEIDNASEFSCGSIKSLPILADDTNAPHSDHTETDARKKAGVSHKSGSKVETSNCPYSRDELICMKCWLEFCRTGTRSEVPGFGNADYPSGEEYSPFHIHC